MSKCDFCNEDPIRGCRWHCATCQKNSVDYCSDCLISQLGSDHCHPVTHEFIPLHNAQLPDDPETKVTTETEDSNSMFNIKTEIKSENEDSSSTESFSESNWNNTTGYNSEDSHVKDFDEDYVTDVFAPDAKKYNYLDPNFLPELYKSKYIIVCLKIWHSKILKHHKKYEKLSPFF